MLLRWCLHDDASSEYGVRGDCLHREDAAFTPIRIHQKRFTLFDYSTVSCDCHVARVHVDRVVEW